MGINFGGLIDKKEAGEFVVLAQGIKNESKAQATAFLSRISGQKLESMNIESLDHLYADITTGPGNLQKTMSWKKDYFIEALLPYRGIK